MFHLKNMLHLKTGIGLLFSIVFLLLVFPSTAQAQDYKIEGKSIPELRQVTTPFFTTPYFTSQLYFLSFTSTSIKSSEPSFKQISNMPKAWAFDELAFFCRMEVKMEKAAKFPVKFRLGEVQYVEKMEGKY